MRLWPLLLAACAGAWQLPPRARLALRQADALRRDCDRAAVGRSVFATDATSPWAVARCVFEAVARGEEATLWFPCFDDAVAVDALASVVRTNGDRLGARGADALSWPSSPALGVTLRGGESAAVCGGDDDAAAAVEASLRWVDDTLGALRLCPFTRDRSRGAIGLDGVGVASGPVRCVAAEGPGAAALVAAVWASICDLEATPESELSTTLIVSPFFDDDFDDFVAVCDGIIEPAVEATGATELVGRAWFHPRYEAAAVGHDVMVPGHALPAPVVRSFVERYANDAAPSDAQLAAANDAVRRTPHATVNLLRRSQLAAAQRLEASLPKAQPNLVYARNVQTMLRRMAPTPR